MVWPFSKKVPVVLDCKKDGCTHAMHTIYVEKISSEDIKKMDPGVIMVPRKFVTESRPYDRAALRQALVNNRSRQLKGSGQIYWDSVVATIEKQLNLHPIL